MKTFFTMVCASILATSVFASNCEIKIEGSDMMKYDVAEITLDTSCEQTKISLKHAGKLPINAMGHNVVIVEEKNLSKITQQINFSLGVEKGYLPESEHIIFISAMVGGGDTTELEMDMSKLDKTKSYVFFCSFPGHWALMRGKIKII
ncbi:MAG: azurin [bacterium]